MGKHRKNSHIRRIAIAAVAVGAVGVPSVAMACSQWPDGGGNQYSSAGMTTAADWRSEAAWDHDWKGIAGSELPSAASQTPTASASAAQTTAPKPATTAPSHTAKTKAPKPRVTAYHRPPKATASATPTSANTPKASASTPTSATPPSANTPKATASTPTSATPPSASTPSASTPTATATASGAAARIVELVNAERSKVGCSAVTLNATLTKAAQAHSADMAAHQNMSHTGSDGSAPGDRITSAGYNWSTYGENIAYGYATPEQVMAGWMASPGHKANILNCAFKEIGVGLAQPNDYWTQDFGTAR
ncbi:CAP domain-containing protein [Streptomyces sp. NPDC001315]|uniref:CAP domain-containing protein n=1 Tax=Streptomyces sp. NPDC001315 TaxID=3364562 RepID=UPI0036AD2107